MQSRAPAQNPLQQRLLAKAEAEAAMIASPDDPAAREAAFAALAPLAAGRTGLLHVVLPELGQPLHLRAGGGDLDALRRSFAADRHPGRIAVDFFGGISVSMVAVRPCEVTDVPFRYFYV